MCTHTQVCKVDIRDIGRDNITTVHAMYFTEAHALAHGVTKDMMDTCNGCGFNWSPPETVKETKLMLAILGRGVPEDHARRLLDSENAGTADSPSWVSVHFAADKDVTASIPAGCAVVKEIVVFTGEGDD